MIKELITPTNGYLFSTYFQNHYDYPDKFEHINSASEYDLKNCEAKDLYLLVDSYSDYGSNSKSIAMANIKAIEEFVNDNNLDTEGKYFHTIYGGYGSVGLLIRSDFENGDIEEMISGLENYPVIDDMLHFEIEVELQEEEYDKFYRDEFIGKLGKKFNIEIIIEDDKYPNYENIDLLFHDKQESSGIYWEENSEGMYIDLDRIIEEVRLEDLDDYEIKYEKE